jgi:transcription elongation factor Elf1
MNKRKIKLHSFGVKPNSVWCYPLYRIVPSDNTIICPHCASVNMSDAQFDIVQYGLERDDHVITVFECRSCETWFAAEYNTGEIE